MQEGRLITYFSKALLEQAHLKSIYEQELMAIVLVVQKLAYYLIGKRFIIQTDQRSLHFLIDRGYFNQINSDNKVMDVLSCQLMENGELNYISTTRAINVQTIGKMV